MWGKQTLHHNKIATATAMPSVMETHIINNLVVMATHLHPDQVTMATTKYGSTD